ncbi:MAG: FAD-dependent oxidoreductase [Alphaproteobacteria bacterium]
MKRDLTAFADTEFDLAIIGGGVTGATIAWDATLRGLKVALVEKDDFGQWTSAASSKLIHGGLRYLKQGQFGVVLESLKERYIWETIAPHMVQPLAFMLPTYGWGMKGPFVLGLGLHAYDFMGNLTQAPLDPEKKVPRHRRMNRQNTEIRAPFIKPDKLTGAQLYYDCQMLHPERMVLECLQGAAARGTAIANYTAATGLLTAGNGQVEGVTVRDELSGESHTIKARLTINAAGPWADQVMGLAANDGDAPSRRLIRSKGIHVIVPDTLGLGLSEHGHPIGMAVAAQGSHFFMIPWRDHIIIGTTDTKFDDAPDSVRPLDEDVDALLSLVNEALPGLTITRKDVVHAYAGLRPLIDTQTEVDTGTAEADDTYGASRAAEIFDHAEDGHPGLLSALGGKWTTSRHLAEQVVDQAVAELSAILPECSTATTPLFGGNILRYTAYENAIAAEHKGTADEATLRYLASIYGSRAPEIINLIEPGDAPLAPGRYEVPAQVRRAIKNEMAQNLRDIVFRRTGIGTLGHPGWTALAAIAAIAAPLLGWDEARIAQEIADCDKAFAVPENGLG